MLKKIGSKVALETPPVDILGKDFDPSHLPVVYYDNSTGKLKVCATDITARVAGEPIGLVIIPTTHTDHIENLKGKVVIMSLNSMDNTNPERGAIDVTSPVGFWAGKLVWSNNDKLPQTWVSLPGYVYNFNTSIINRDNGNSPNLEGVDATVPSTSGTAIYSVSSFSSTMKPSNEAPVLGYLVDAVGTQVVYIDSPFIIKRGKFLFNEKYASLKFGSTEIVRNTVTRVRYQPDWYSAPIIINYADAQNALIDSTAPYACCCARYTTPGTKRGQWYTPTLADALYIRALDGYINTAYTAMGRMFTSHSAFMNVCNYPILVGERKMSSGGMFIAPDGYIGASDPIQFSVVAPALCAIDVNDLWQ